MKTENSKVLNHKKPDQRRFGQAKKYLKKKTKAIALLLL